HHPDERPRHRLPHQRRQRQRVQQPALRRGHVHTLRRFGQVHLRNRRPAHYVEPRQPTRRQRRRRSLIHKHPPNVPDDAGPRREHASPSTRRFPPPSKTTRHSIKP